MMITKQTIFKLTTQILLVWGRGSSQSLAKLEAKFNRVYAYLSTVEGHEEEKKEFNKLLYLLGRKQLS